MELASGVGKTQSSRGCIKGAQRKRLERNLDPAEIGPRHRGALKAGIHVWISKFAVRRHARRADPRWVAQNTDVE